MLENWLLIRSIIAPGRIFFSRVNSGMLVLTSTPWGVSCPFLSQDWASYWPWICSRVKFQPWLFSFNSRWCCILLLRPSCKGLLVTPLSPQQSLVAPWDLNLALSFLKTPPFEAIGTSIWPISLQSFFYRYYFFKESVRACCFIL